MTKEDAINVLKTHYHKNPRTSYGVMVKQATEMAIDVLENQKHAHWKKSKTTEGMIYCSLCHYNQYVYKTPFCALCGARMDEKEGADNGTQTD